MFHEMPKIHNHGHKILFPFLTVADDLRRPSERVVWSSCGSNGRIRRSALYLAFALSTVIMDAVLCMKLFYSLFGEAFKFYLNLFQRSEKNRFNFKKQISFLIILKV